MEGTTAHMGPVSGAVVTGRSILITGNARGAECGIDRVMVAVHRDHPRSPGRQNFSDGSADRARSPSADRDLSGEFRSVHLVSWSASGAA